MNNEDRVKQLIAEKLQQLIIDMIHGWKSSGISSKQRTMAILKQSDIVTHCPDAYDTLINNYIFEITNNFKAYSIPLDPVSIDTYVYMRKSVGIASGFPVCSYEASLIKVATDKLKVDCLVDGYTPPEKGRIPDPLELMYPTVYEKFYSDDLGMVVELPTYRRSVIQATLGNPVDAVDTTPIAVNRLQTEYMGNITEEKAKLLDGYADKVTYSVRGVITTWISGVRTYLVRSQEE